MFPFRLLGYIVNNLLADYLEGVAVSFRRWYALRNDKEDDTAVVDAITGYQVKYVIWRKPDAVNQCESFQKDGMSAPLSASR